MDEFELDDDDFGTPLPVLDTPDTSAPVERPKRWRPDVRVRGARSKGGVPRDQASMARSEALSAATGRGAAAVDEWRTLLRGGDRRKAVAAVDRTNLTHNAGNGFGLAEHFRAPR
jgi:hypothetical protein